MSNLLPEDRAFFLELFQAAALDQESVAPHFDLRPAPVKRREFARVRNAALKALLATHGPVCMLGFPDICDANSGWEVDHLIPLQSNELNKRLRGMVRRPPKKVPQLSYGSNDALNLILACARCNGHKKHRFLEPEHLRRVFAHNSPVRPRSCPATGSA